MLIRIPLNLSFGVALSSAEILLAHCKLTTDMMYLMLSMTRGKHGNSSQKTSSTCIQLIGKPVCVVRSLGFPGSIQAHQHNPRAETQILNYSDADEWFCKRIYLGNHHSWRNRSHRASVTQSQFQLNRSKGQTHLHSGSLDASTNPQCYCTVLSIQAWLLSDLAPA